MLPIMSARADGNLKAAIEAAYAPVEDDSFVNAIDEASKSGYTGCYVTLPGYMPSC